MSWFATTPLSFVFIPISVICIYISLVVLTRWAGVRSFSKLSGFDFAVTVAIGSLIASTVLAKDPPLAQGVVALASLFAIQMLVAHLRVTFPDAMSFVDNRPRIIMVGDAMIKDQMAKAKITENDLWGKLRESNVVNLDQVIVAIAETTGDVTVLHKTDASEDFEARLLTGVANPETYETHKSRSTPKTPSA